MNLHVEVLRLQQRVEALELELERLSKPMLSVNEDGTIASVSEPKRRGRPPNKVSREPLAPGDMIFGESDGAH